MDESQRNLTTTTTTTTTTVVGFSLLPSDLIQYIVFKLALPDILQLKLVNKSIFTITSDQNFVRNYNLHSNSTTWLFIYKKRWRRNAVLDGFSDSCNRWFKIMITDMLNKVVPPDKNFSFLTASRDFFLFALNASHEVISININSKTVKKIPRSPLGLRSMFSWRRSGIKLVTNPTDSTNFKFLFGALVESIPILFEYNSETNNWRSVKTKEVDGYLPSSNKNGNGCTFLSAANRSSGSVIIAVGSNEDAPIVVRPRFDGARTEVGNVIERIHVYGDGRMLIVRSRNREDDQNTRVMVLKSVELWGLSPNGEQWVFISNVPNGLIDKIKKPYKVMMGCLEERQGTIRAVLMSNFEGVWDTIWLCYDVEKRYWNWVPLPDWKMKGNISGITFSSGLTLP